MLLRWKVLMLSHSYLSSSRNAIYWVWIFLQIHSLLQDYYLEELECVAQRVGGKVETKISDLLFSVSGFSGVQIIINVNLQLQSQTVIGRLLQTGHARPTSMMTVAQRRPSSTSSAFWYSTPSSKVLLIVSSISDASANSAASSTSALNWRR